MSLLTDLVELQLTANQLAVLPPWVGDMVGLRQLLLGNNRLESLPYKLGFCSFLTDLQLFNNPLVDPPYAKVRVHMTQFLVFIWFVKFM
jgi:CCR4-NOT transcription complex subunit 6